MLLSPVTAALLSGLLALATPTTPGSSGPVQAAHAAINDGSSDGGTAVAHSLTIPDSSSQETKTDVTLERPELLRLECNLRSDATVTNVTWKHGETMLRSDRYSLTHTDNVWHTALEVFVNRTGSYSCIYTAEAKATFHVKAPVVHGGKALVSYNGDSITLKCDSSTHFPVTWLWYKVTGNETVQLNFSSDPSKYKLDLSHANETKLWISGLDSSDSAEYVCKAVFQTGESEGRVHLSVLSLMAPLKVFIGIAVEVVVLVGCILGYEVLSKRKQSKEGAKTENDQMAHLNPEETSTSEASNARQRKV